MERLHYARLQTRNHKFILIFIKKIKAKHFKRINIPNKCKYIFINFYWTNTFLDWQIKSNFLFQISTHKKVSELRRILISAVSKRYRNFLLQILISKIKNQIKISSKSSQPCRTTRPSTLRLEPCTKAWATKGHLM